MPIPWPRLREAFREVQTISNMDAVRMVERVSKIKMGRMRVASYMETLGYISYYERDERGVVKYWQKME